MAGSIVADPNIYFGRLIRTQLRWVPQKQRCCCLQIFFCSSSVCRETGAALGKNIIAHHIMLPSVLPHFRGTCDSHSGVRLVHSGTRRHMTILTSYSPGAIGALLPFTKCGC